LEEPVDTLEHIRNVVALEMCIELLARGPALDEGEPSRIVGTLSYSEEELVVESVALGVVNGLGLDTSGYSIGGTIPEADAT